MIFWSKSVDTLKEEVISRKLLIKRLRWWLCSNCNISPSENSSLGIYPWGYEPQSAPILPPTRFLHVHDNPVEGHLGSCVSSEIHSLAASFQREAHLSQLHHGGFVNVCSCRAQQDSPPWETELSSSCLHYSSTPYLQTAWSPFRWVLIWLLFMQSIELFMRRNGISTSVCTWGNRDIQSRK